MGGRCAGCGQRRRPRNPLPDRQLDFIEFDGYILFWDMDAAVRTGLRDMMVDLAERHGATVGFATDGIGLRWAYLSGRAPIGASLAARDETLSSSISTTLVPSWCPFMPSSDCFTTTIIFTSDGQGDSG